MSRHAVLEFTVTDAPLATRRNRPDRAGHARRTSARTRLPCWKSGRHKALAEARRFPFCQSSFLSRPLLPPDPSRPICGPSARSGPPPPIVPRKLSTIAAVRELERFSLIIIACRHNPLVQPQPPANVPIYSISRRCLLGSCLCAPHVNYPDTAALSLSSEHGHPSKHPCFARPVYCVQTSLAQAFLFPLYHRKSLVEALSSLRTSSSSRRYSRKLHRG
ncbi:hypothetical protein BV20DRAFT_961879 [Pilatotrama ljubarskyi]|nr:hypothetical protein BV20DRAFT_961879 [Pilatotrama ljubarskyi]